MVWSAYVLSTAIRTALKIAEGPKSWEKEGQFHKGNLNGFKMEPSVKFVSAILDAFSNKKNVGQFFSPKKDQIGRGGGGGEGGLAKDHTFSKSKMFSCPR